MNEISSNAYSAALLPAFTEASLDLIHYGSLSNASERFSMMRARDGSEETAAERDIAARLRTDRARVASAIALARRAAAEQEAFDFGVGEMLLQEPVSAEAAAVFSERLDAGNGNYAKAALALCDRLESAFSDTSESESAKNDPPPVSGGSISGCDLIALGSMLGGATCVMGCGECCIAGAAGALIYVAAC